MFKVAFNFYSLLLRWTVYLAITGQLVTALPNMQNNAYKSVTTGLMSLGDLNRSLHGQQAQAVYKSSSQYSSK